jgi:hypothetical protein
MEGQVSIRRETLSIAKKIFVRHSLGFVKQICGSRTLIVPEAPP